MYGWLWRALPRPIWAKFLICAVIVAIVLVVLVVWVFPPIDDFLTNEEVTF
jgi:hypothetical protein